MHFRKVGNSVSELATPGFPEGTGISVGSSVLGRVPSPSFA